MNLKLHERLVAKQTTKELKRKCDKAGHNDIWTQEEIDYAKRCGAELYESIFAPDDLT